MRIERKQGPGNAVGAWHIPRSDDLSRWACKRWSRSAYRRTQKGDLRNLKAGDSVCRDCAAIEPALAERTQVVTQQKQVRVAHRVDGAVRTL